MSIGREIVKRVNVELSERRRWGNKASFDRSSIRVFYGHERLPDAKDAVYGGIVKTRDLQVLFPNALKRPSVLYLISSALPLYAARMARIAQCSGAIVVVNQNGVAYPAWHGAGWQRVNRFMKEVMEQSDYVFFQSEFCKLGSDRYLGERVGRCEVLYNPVETSFFSPPDNRLPLTPFRLLLAGTHTHFYRAQTAVDAMRQVREKGVDARLEIAGRYCWHANPQEAQADLSAYINDQSLADVITVSGPYTQESARELFQRSHLLLHTKYNDPCPRLVVEAMSSGLPIVYSASGGTPELVGDEAGIGIPAPLDWDKDHPPAPEALAEAICKVAEKYDDYARAARQRAVSRFDVKPWLNRHREVFLRLLESAA